MHIVDAGGSIAFQLPLDEPRANQNHLHAGTRGPDAERIGNIKTVYSVSRFWTTGAVR